jgi:predicted dehydrogenase
MAARLRVGIIGLGRSWRRHYRPALAALSDRYQVRAVTDPCPLRAATAARELGCAAAPGVLDLLEGELDAVLLLGRPWYRLWPLEQACRLGRPIYCGTSLAEDEACADVVAQQARVNNLPVMTGLWPRLAPAAERLRGLTERLGPLRCVIATAERPGRGGGVTGARAAGLALLDWCARLLGRAPEAVRGLGEPAAGQAGWLAEFGGPVAQIATWPGGGRRGTARFKLVGARGTAEAVLPRRVRWRRGAARHTVVLPAGPPAARLALDRFHTALTTGHAPAPGLDDAYHALAWLRAAR